MNVFLLLWLFIAVVRVGYLWMVWYIWPKLGGYVCWIDGPLNLLLLFFVPETVLWMVLCSMTRKNDLAPDAALIVPFMFRFSLCLLATSFLIALLVFRCRG